MKIIRNLRVLIPPVFATVRICCPLARFTREHNTFANTLQTQCATSDGWQQYRGIAETWANWIQDIIKRCNDDEKIWWKSTRKQF